MKGRTRKFGFSLFFSSPSQSFPSGQRADFARAVLRHSSPAEFLRTDTSFSGPNPKVPWNGSSPFGKPPEAEDYESLRSPLRTAAPSRPASIPPDWRRNHCPLAYKTGDRVLYLPAGAPDAVLHPDQHHARERAGSGTNHPASRREAPEPKPFPAPLSKAAPFFFQSQSEESSPATGFSRYPESPPGLQLWQEAGALALKTGARLLSYMSQTSRAEDAFDLPDFQRRSPGRKPFTSAPGGLPFADKNAFLPVGAARPGLPARGQGVQTSMFSRELRPAGPRLRKASGWPTRWAASLLWGRSASSSSKA